MPGNDREVFLYLKSDETTPEAEDLLTFAMFAYEKDEWIKHYADKHGSEPTQVEIDNWTANITDYHFARMREKAATFFDTAAREYLRDEIAAGKQQVLESEIVNRVRAAGAFWKQLVIALVTAVLTPILLGAVIGGILTYNQVVPALVKFSAPQQSSVNSEPGK
jgi:hypothetical protein